MSEDLLEVYCIYLYIYILFGKKNTTTDFNIHCNFIKQFGHNLRALTFLLEYWAGYFVSKFIMKAWSCKLVCKTCILIILNILYYSCCLRHNTTENAIFVKAACYFIVPTFCNFLYDTFFSLTDPLPYIFVWCEVCMQVCVFFLLLLQIIKLFKQYILFVFWCMWQMF